MGYVRLSKIEKSFGRVKVLHEINLDIERGKFLVLLGPSGCGKSTLLRMIAGLETVTSGDIHIDDKCVNTVHPKDRDIAMVFQNYALYPDKTVLENMAFGLRMRRVSKDVIDNKISEAAAILGLEELLERKPGQLSGGQRQRVAVGRAMVRDPKVFLFDEPLSNLDAHLRVRMRAELVKLHQQLQTTMIYVTHDQVEAMTMGDVIAVLNNGYLVQSGSPREVFHRPNSIFSASFIGSPGMNLHAGEVVQDSNNALGLRIGEITHPIPASCMELLQPYVGRTVTLGVRPQSLKVAANVPNDGDHAAATTAFNGHIEAIEELGTETIAHLSSEGLSWDAVASDAQSLKAGQDVWVSFSGLDAHYFDPVTEAIICHGSA